MSKPPSLSIDLDQLRLGLPGITKERGAGYAQAGALCLSDHDHESGVSMRVDGDTVLDCTVHWQQKIDDDIRAAWDREEPIEDGAMGIAALLAPHTTPYAIIERARKDGGFDYWLGHKNTFPFRRSARLEISGTMGQDKEVRARVKSKKKQTNVSDSTQLPAYVIIVGFRSPLTIVSKK